MNILDYGTAIMEDAYDNNSIPSTGTMDTWGWVITIIAIILGIAYVYFAFHDD